MKKILILLPLFLLLFPLSEVLAASVTLDNYHWIHTNTIGDSQFLKDKYGNSVIKGDATQNDAYITNIQFETEGMSGVKLYVVYPDGTKSLVSNGVIAITKKVKSVSLSIDKTTNKETWVAVRTLNTDDASDGGVDVSYGYTLNTPTRYGDLGDGSVIVPDPGNGGGETTEPEPDVGSITAQWNAGTKRITWSSYPSSTYEVVVTYPNGQQIKLTPTTKVLRVPDGLNGNFVVSALSASGEVLAKKTLTVTGNTEETTDPGTDPIEPTDPEPTEPTDPEPTDPTEPICTEACQNLIDQLECPEWGQYLGSWMNGIKNTYPTLANEITNQLVPAMGQEMVNVAPRIADIIADEFESRETPVAQPNDIPGFDPVVPRFVDTPSVKGDLTSNVPDFTPDYSKSQGFTIPDPLDLDFTDNSDGGYAYPDKTDNSAPVYKKVEVTEAPPRYVPTMIWNEDIKQYKLEYSESGTTERDYKITNSDGGTMPNYQPKEPTTSNPNYNSGEDNAIPNYLIK